MDILSSTLKRPYQRAFLLIKNSATINVKTAAGAARNR